MSIDIRSLYAPVFYRRPSGLERGGIFSSCQFESMYMPSALNSIKNFLAARKTEYSSGLIERFLAHADCMEFQVNVAAGIGERVPGTKSTFTDGLDKWFSYRIPKHADSDPEFRDYELNYALDDHADGIGTTGWDWKNLVSRAVGFDFDSIVGHAAGVGVTKDELDKVKQAAMSLSYVEARRSTSGSGIHLWVNIDEIPTATHTEHAALARCILGCMSRDAGYDFSAQVDACGGNMWLWHRKATGTNGFELIKAAERTFGAEDLPANWKEHIAVIQRRATRVRVHGISTDDQDPFELLASAHRRVPLDDKHKLIMSELEKTGASVIWISDHHLLQTHTKAFDHVANGTEPCPHCHGTGIDPEFDDPDDLGLEPPACQKCKGVPPRTADRLGITGVFQTNSRGSDLGSPNCFAFPLDNGGWKVYRFSPGISEARTWECDGNGWTTCTFNVAPDLRQACIGVGGRELSTKGFEFDSVRKALEAARILNPKAQIEIEPHLLDRKAVVKPSKDGRFTLQIAKKQDDDEQIGDWNSSDKKGHWTQVLPISTDNQQRTTDTTVYDNIIRALETVSGEPAGWAVKKRTDGSWTRKTASSVKTILQSLGHSKPEAEEIMGFAEHGPWKLICVPFQPEYPGDRQWNLGAPQLRFTPAPREESKTPTWDLLWGHFGEGLTAAVKEDPWCKKHGITTGRDYLYTGIACHIRKPFTRLPLMTAYSKSENTGKSTTVSSLDYLVAPHGVVTISDESLKKTFNGPLATAWVAMISESDASKSRERIKDWVTTSKLQIRELYRSEETKQVYFWLFHTINSMEYSPVHERDQRVVLWEVGPIKDRLDPDKLQRQLEEEAPAFLRQMLDTELPPAAGRLYLPILTTDVKELAIAGQYQDNDDRQVFRDFVDQYIENGPGKITTHDFSVKYGEYAKQRGVVEISTQSRLKLLMTFGFKVAMDRNNQPNKLCEGRSRAYVGIRWKADAC